MFPSNHRKILIVEDNYNLHTLWMQGLRAKDYLCDSAFDGLSALEMIEKGKYAVGIFDINLPKLDGLELLAQCSIIDPDLTVILVAGEPQVGMVIHAMKLGAFAFLRKPFSFDELFLEIRNALNHRELTIEHRLWAQNLKSQVEQRTQELNSVLESIGAGLQVLDCEGNVVWSNLIAQKWFGEVSNWKAMMETQMPDLVPCNCPQCTVFQSARIMSYQFSYRCLDEQVREFQITCSPIVSSQQQVMRAVSLIQDITERNLLERELIRTERLASLGEIVAGLAHEINNPIGIILGLVQNILTEIDIGYPFYQDLKIIEEETLRTGKVIKSLLAYAQQPAPLKEEIDLVELWRSCLRFLDFMLKMNKITVNTTIDTQSPKIKGDKELLKQVYLNLLFNSIHSLPQGGNISFKIETLEAKTEDKIRLHITISDNGSGISPNDLPQVFRPFFTTKAKKGTGLGLTICKRIIEGHGGTIDLESKLGEGTICHIILPKS
jgi:signal transduction histidine kinase/DNA-binding response OmpR family regulator